MTNHYPNEQDAALQRFAREGQLAKRIEALEAERDALLAENNRLRAFASAVSDEKRDRLYKALGYKP